MEKEGWKVLALTFIGLTAVVIVTFVLLMNMGLSLVEEEDRCAIEICNSADSFYYDSDSGVCKCYTNGISNPVTVENMRE